MTRRALLSLVVAVALSLVAILTLALSSSPDPKPAAAAPSDPAAPRIHPLPPLREQAKEQQAWLAKRLTEVLPKVMREHGIEMWILSMREYAEDPVFFSMVSPTTFAARRRSIYVFHDQGPTKGVERLALGGSDQGGLYTIYRDPKPSVAGAELVGDDQWRLLRQLVEKADPKTIALDVDPVNAFADGLHAGEREALEAALGPSLVKRVVREPRLAIELVGTRVPEMLPRYREVQETVHALITMAFSKDVVHPGDTTTEDVEWWLRQRVQELGMTVWFQPDVERATAGVGWSKGTIQRGDALWVDFGVIAMNLHTDTQHLGYVLRPGETGPPPGLLACLATTNRLQDLLLAEMKPGRTGNETLKTARAEMSRQGIDGTIYSHPIGDHGHGAGPLIGLWDRQEGVPVRGDLAIRPSTWFSIELQATSPIPEWKDQKLACRQEEDAYLDENGDRHWAFRHQERFHLVR
ncbi:MAG TPA: M24 family metallopeptidase [Thermoanaerobaculia bacterium]|nr:M24 family metallopeptidase [Thermoanaerobaculia bacterium]